ncbi:MAG: hypothetical protein IRZ28_21705 [Steroidobacteraceae bacterium]|nr:hypothetical protein [Steroidobacteraceae bacterium]
MHDDPGVWADLQTADYDTGVSSTDQFVIDTPSAPTGLVATGRLNGIEFTWSQPAGQLALSETELWEYTASTPFASATRVANGISSPFLLPKDDATTRYYWIRQRALYGAGVSSTEPAGAGIPGAALRVDIESITGTGTLSDVSGSPTTTIFFTRTGRVVHASIGAVTGTSVGILCQVFGGTPAGWRPSRWQSASCTVIDNGLRVPGRVFIGPGSGDFVLEVARDNGNTDFTPSGTKGVPAEGISITYTLD